MYYVPYARSCHACQQPIHKGSCLLACLSLGLMHCDAPINPSPSELSATAHAQWPLLPYVWPGPWHYLVPCSYDLRQASSPQQMPARPDTCPSEGKFWPQRLGWINSSAVPALPATLDLCLDVHLACLAKRELLNMHLIITECCGGIILSSNRVASDWILQARSARHNFAFMMVPVTSPFLPN